MVRAKVCQSGFVNGTYPHGISCNLQALAIATVSSLQLYGPSFVTLSRGLEALWAQQWPQVKHFKYHMPKAYLAMANFAGLLGGNVRLHAAKLVI
jgi:hypothetical protein